jgi:glycosyltransferase involved in cell wall biosynthesis
MKVSIITVCFNSAATIRDTIESVRAQNYPSVEYIIVDGGSTDGTLDIIKEYGDSISILISEPDNGIYDAMNKGIRAATGDVVATLNSDDFYVDSSSVQRLVACMEMSDSETVFADLVLIDPDDTEKTIRYYDSSRFHPKKLKYGWMPAHPTFLAKRVLFDEWGLYSLDYHIAADFEMIVRLLHRAKVSYAYLPEVAVKMRTGGVSTANFRNSWVLNNEIVRACRENGLETSLPRVLMKIPAKLFEYVRRPKSYTKKASL